jgi:hypothetical protein
MTYALMNSLGFWFTHVTPAGVPVGSPISLGDHPGVDALAIAAVGPDTVTLLDNPGTLQLARLDSNGALVYGARTLANEPFGGGWRGSRAARMHSRAPDLVVAWIGGNLRGIGIARVAP